MIPELVADGNNAKTIIRNTSLSGGIASNFLIANGVTIYHFVNRISYRIKTNTNYVIIICANRFGFLVITISIDITNILI
jgi:hypothetical protein